MSIKQKIIGVLLAIVAFLGGGYTLNNQLGNVGSAASGYNATSTSSSWDGICAAAGPRQVLLKNGPGVLGSVLILTETAGIIRLVDATSTNHGHYATTSVMDITIPASAAENSYPFNTIFNRGLLAVCTGSTNVASGTITWQ